MRKLVSDLRTRLQIAKEVLKERDYNGQIMTCGKCGSTYINKVEELKTDPMHYTAKYVCENCGSCCIENQEWE